MLITLVGRCAGHIFRKKFSNERLTQDIAPRVAAGASRDQLGLRLGTPKGFHWMRFKLCFHPPARRRRTGALHLPHGWSTLRGP